MSKSILIIFAVMYSLAGYSQSLPHFSTNKQKPRHYFFTHYTTTSGLVSYQVNTTVQDEAGYIWIGTNDGLQRYDGVRFKTFRHTDGDSSSLPSNLIWQLLIDKSKNIWVLTIDGKAGIFNTKTFKFSPVAIKVRNEEFFLSNARFKRLITDEFGNVFLLVPGSEVAGYNKITRSFDTDNKIPALTQNLKTTGFAQQPGTHKYWMCSEEHGLTVYDEVTGQVSQAENNAGNESAIEALKGEQHVTELFFDKHRRLWIIGKTADTPYVSCYDMQNRKVILKNYQFDIRTLGYHEIRSFFEQSDGSIWIIGQKAFARFLDKEKQFELVYNGFEEEHGIDYITITCLIEDRENNMWASTANNGIFRFNPSKDFFSNFNYVSHTTSQQGGGAPMSFIQDKDESLLVGIREDGFYRFDKNMQQVPLGIKGIPDKNTNVIWNMCAGADSNIIWMAAQNGVYKYHRDKKLAVFYQPAALKNKTVKRIVEDRQHNLWLGTQEAGVFKWNPEKGKKKFDDGLISFAGITTTRINKLLLDQQGYIWIATNGEGAYMIDPANDSILKHFHLHGAPAMKLPEQSVLSMLDYNDSLMIIGCSSRLMVYNRLREKIYSLGSPLSGFIASIEKDDEAHLWVSTTTSLYRVTVSNRVFLQMNRNDGLSNDYFLADGSYVLPDKRMVFGVYGSFVTFLPSALNTAPMFPDLQITGLVVKDKSLRVDSLLAQKLIVLGAEENSITIDLSVLSYNSGYLLRYKLENLDKTWKTVGQNYQLIYSYLPPGNYTLNVETIDAEGKKGEKTLKIAIRITPPFWKTWWFYSLLLLGLVLVLFRLDFQRTKRREAVHKMRSNIAGNLHREVNTALNNINILSEMARLKADNNPEKSKEFIGQINIKSEHMIIAMDDMLWSIDPANDSMLKTIERLREFIETLNSRHNAGINMQVDKNIEKLRLHMQLRHEVLLLFKESILNQIQCGARNIIINLAYEKSNLVFRIQFDPENCNLTQLNNFLYSKDMEKRLQVMHAKLSADENKSNALVVIRLPVM